MHGIAKILAGGRERSGLKQSEVARRMKVDPSRLSRIESGELSASPEEVARYVSALGSPVGDHVDLYLKRTWKAIQPPSPWHPDFETLWTVEDSLARLEKLERSSGFPEVLKTQVTSLRESLLASARFLLDLDHRVAFIGGVGKGKTTALCLLSGLVVPAKDGFAFENVALEASGGRTTLCEVDIKTGPAYGIIIEPRSRGEIEELVSDLVESRVPPSDSSETHREKGVSIEIENALRHMAGLAMRKGKNGQRLDPFLEVIEKEVADLGGGLNKDQRKIILTNIVADFIRAMDLSSRVQLESFYDGLEADGMKWLQTNFRLINRGRNKQFTLPRLITVLVPKSVLKQEPYELSLLDTKGVDETAVRQDIRRQLTDARTLCVFCSSFNDAPDAVVSNLLSQIVDSGLDTIDRERAMVLVLAKSGEAMKATDGGDLPETEDEGFEIKGHHLHQDLRRLGAEKIPIHFFNAATPTADRARQAVLDQVTRMRDNQTRRVRTLRDAVDHLIKNKNQVKLKEAQKNILEALLRYAGRHTKMRERTEQPYERMLSELSKTSPRSIWASTRRGGTWYNFDVYHYLGLGVENDARRRTVQAVGGLYELLDEMSSNPETKPAAKFVTSLREKAIDWHHTFLSECLEIGATAYRTALGDNEAIWSRCEERWGMGGGYRGDIGETLKEWFLGEGLPIGDLVERRVRSAWREHFIREIHRISETPET